MRTYKCSEWTPGEKLTLARSMRRELRDRGYDGTLRVETDYLGVHIHATEPIEPEALGLLDAIYLEHAAELAHVPKGGDEW